METRLNRFNNVDKTLLGTATLVCVAMVLTTAKNGMKENVKTNEILGWIQIGLVIISSIYNISRMVTSSDRFKRTYEKAVAKTEAAEAKKNVIIEYKPKKHIDIPVKAAQKQHKKPKQPIGFFSRLQTGFLDLMNSCFKKTPVKAETSPDDSVEFEIEPKALKSSNPKKKKKRQFVKPSNKSVSSKTPKVKETFSNSTTHIRALTPPSQSVDAFKKINSKSESDSESESESENENEKKHNPPTPNVSLVSSQPAQPDVLSTPSVVEEKSVLRFQSLAKEVDEIKHEHSELKNTSQTAIEEIHVMGQRMDEMAYHLQQMDNLLDLDRQIFTQTEHLAALAALQDPLHTYSGNNRVYTAEEHHRNLMTKRLTSMRLAACKQLGNTSPPDPHQAQEEPQDALRQHRKYR